MSSFAPLTISPRPSAPWFSSLLIPRLSCCSSSLQPPSVILCPLSRPCSAGTTLTPSYGSRTSGSGTSSALAYGDPTPSSTTFGNSTLTKLNFMISSKSYDSSYFTLYPFQKFLFSTVLYVSCATMFHQGFIFYFSRVSQVHSFATSAHGPLTRVYLMLSMVHLVSWRLLRYDVVVTLHLLGVQVLRSCTVQCRHTPSGLSGDFSSVTQVLYFVTYVTLPLRSSAPLLHARVHISSVI